MSSASRRLAPHPTPARCPGCALPQRFCFCELLSPLEGSCLPVHWIHHRDEVVRSSSSSRAVSLALPAAQFYPWSGRMDWSSISIPPGSCLLFPGEDSQPIEACSVAPSSLVVVDGSWRQARKMVNFVPELQTLPRVSVTLTDSEPGMLRRQHQPGQGSAAAALSAALRALGYESAAEHLTDTRALQIRHILASRGLNLRTRREQLLQSSRPPKGLNA